MKKDFHPQKIRTGRMTALAFILMALVSAAMILLPAGLVRLSVMAFLLIPPMLLIFDRPEWLFHLLLFLIFSNLHIFSDLPTIKLTSILLIATFAVSVLRGRDVVVHDLGFTMLIAAFYLLAFQSMSFARDIDSSLMRFEIFTRVMIYLFFIVQFARTRRQLLLMLVVIVCGGIVDSFMPFIVPPPEAKADLSLMWNQAVYRYEGYNGEANRFAFTLNFLIPLQFFLFARLRRPWFLRPLILAAIGGSMFVLFLSFSRGGFLGLVFLFLALLFIERRNKAILMTGLALVAAGAILAPAAYWERIGSIAEIGNRMTDDTSILSRLHTMKIAFVLGLKNPVFGIGIENFLFYVNRSIPFGNFVHNSLLQVFSDLGLIAFTVVVSMIVYNFRIILFLARKKEDPEAALMGRILFIQQVAVVVNSMFLPVAFHMVFLLTLILPSIARYVYGRSPDESRDRPPELRESKPAVHG